MTADDVLTLLPPDLPVRDCAGCGRVVVTRRAAVEFLRRPDRPGCGALRDVQLPDGVSYFGDEAAGRPYCRGVLAAAVRAAEGGGRWLRRRTTASRGWRDLPGSS